MTKLPTHPGKTLARMLRERGISLNRVARDTRMVLSRVSLVASGKQSITADTALRLGRYLGTSPELWMKLQAAYDLAIAERKAGKAIRRDVIPAAATA
jgi:addiction module HigA family antidote